MAYDFLRIWNAWIVSTLILRGKTESRILMILDFYHSYVMVLQLLARIFMTNTSICHLASGPYLTNSRVVFFSSAKCFSIPSTLKKF